MRKITGECRYNGDCEYRNDSSNWLQIETAPKDEPILLRWIGKTDRAEVTMGQVSSHEEGKYWNGDTYLPIEYITHWRPLPSSEL